MADDQTVKALAKILLLQDTEEETLRAVFKHCAKLGIASGGGLAVATSGVGTVVVPGVGGVPGWLVGFAAGWASGTLVCTMAHRGVVIEGLKQIISDSKRFSVSEEQAVGMFRVELSRHKKSASKA